jgi:hypothetical protein
LLISRIHTVVSDEPEPQTLLQTCLLVYRLLATAKFGRGGIQSEWQAFDAYRPTETFEKFLDSNLHLPLQNIALLQEYLDLVYSLLDRATGCAYKHVSPPRRHPARETGAAAQLLGVRIQSRSTSCLVPLQADMAAESHGSWFCQDT